MKISLFFVAAFCVATVSSCSVHELDNVVAHSSEPQVIEITATLDDSGITKTVRKEDGKIYWSPADNINVFFGNENAKFTSKNTEDALTATFSGSITGVVGMNEGGEAGKYIWGLYPYKANATSDGLSVTTSLSDIQTAVAGSFADDLFITLAKNDCFSLAFYNVLSGFRFTLAREGITKMTFSGNNGEVLTGTLKMAFGEDSRPVVQEITNGKTKIILTAEGDTFEVGKDYYFVFAPTTFDKGFTVTMETADSKGSFVYDSSITFARNNFSRRQEVDSGIAFSQKEPEYVDLGLSVKWAKTNVGATEPEGYGDYYAWGEIEPKDTYDLSSYKWYKETVRIYQYGDFNLYSKYNYFSNAYFDYLLDSSDWQTAIDPNSVDNSMALDPVDDVAHVKMGGKWRMPSSEEWDELINPDNCTWEWTTLNDVNGYKVTSKKEGFTDNWIFLPAAGHAPRYEGGPQNDGTAGQYWSLSLDNLDRSSGPIRSLSLGFRSNFYSIVKGATYRYEGLSIRPVYGDRVTVTDIALNRTTLNIFCGENFDFMASLSPSDCANKGIKWSSDPTVACVSSTGYLTTGSAGNSGSVVITATTIDGEITATCDVTVQKQQSGTDMIDLGLSVKWGARNLDNINGIFGDSRYGWDWGNGEHPTGGLIGKELAYAKWCENGTYIKYNATDKKMVLDPEDDSATTYWTRYLSSGSNPPAKWRTPTKEEWEELINPDNCTWEWTTINDIKGYKVTSKKEGFKDKMIFLPDNGSYWTSLLDMSYSNYGYAFCVNIDRGRIESESRNTCLHIRPVSE